MHVRSGPRFPGGKHVTPPPAARSRSVGLAAPRPRRWSHWSAGPRRQAIPVAGGPAGRDAILCRLPTYGLRSRRPPALFSRREERISTGPVRRPITVRRYPLCSSPSSSRRVNRTVAGDAPLLLIRRPPTRPTRPIDVPANFPGTIDSPQWPPTITSVSRTVAPNTRKCVTF